MPWNEGKRVFPGSLVAAGLAGCPLISMAKFAERHGLDVSGALLDVGHVDGQVPEKRIGVTDVTMRMPRDFSTAHRGWCLLVAALFSAAARSIDTSRNSSATAGLADLDETYIDDRVFR